MTSIKDIKNNVVFKTNEEHYMKYCELPGIVRVSLDSFECGEATEEGMRKVLLDGIYGPILTRVDEACQNIEKQLRTVPKDNPALNGILTEIAKLQADLKELY